MYLRLCGLACPRLLATLCLGFGLVSGLQWSWTVREGQAINVCTGQDVVIAWSFSLAPGETTDLIEWRYRGQSEEVVAMFSNNIFFPLPAFSQRVQFTPNAGLLLSHVTEGDSGNYSVHVTTRDTSGRRLNSRHDIILTVSDGQLHVTQEVDAMLDPSSHQWSIVLTCGQFTFTRQPSFTVEWVTPSGQQLDSSSYRNGQFTLLLTRPVEGGSYTCRVPQQQLAAACLQGNTLSQATLDVDGTAATMVLLIAELAELKQINAEQAAEIHRLQNITHRQQDEIDPLTSTTADPTAEEPCVDLYTGDCLIDLAGGCHTSFVQAVCQHSCNLCT